VKANDIPDGYERFDRALSERTGFHLHEQSPLEYAKSIHIPTLVAQVHDDSMTRPEDVQAIYDAIPVEEKKLVWVQGTTRRFDGYNYFGEHPEIPIDWFNSHAA
jgi:esterase/lipase